LDQFSRTQPVDDKVWDEFSRHIFYCVGDMTDAAAYGKLAKQLTGFGSEALRRNRLFYLATMPSQFGQVAEQLHGAGLLERDDKTARLVVEKPFGHDLASARQLNAELTRFAGE